jgi:hypothetical protein
MVTTNHRRFQFTLTGMILCLSFLCATMALWRLGFRFPSQGVGYFGASFILICATMGAITAGRGSTPVEDAVFWAILSPVVAIGLLGVACIGVVIVAVFLGGW